MSRHCSSRRVGSMTLSYWQLGVIVLVNDAYANSILTAALGMSESESEKCVAGHWHMFPNRLPQIASIPLAKNPMK